MEHDLSSAFFMQNRDRLRQWLPPRSTVIVWSGVHQVRSADLVYPFHVNPNFWYLTGLAEPGMVLLYTPDYPEEELRAVLVVPEATEVRARWEGVFFGVEDYIRVSGIRTVRTVDELWGLLARLLWHSTYVYVDVNEHDRYGVGVLDPVRQWVEDLKRRYPVHEYRRLAPVMAQLRMRKGEEELSCIRRAIGVAAEVFREEVLPGVAPGVWEYEVEGRLVGGLVRRGSLPAFPPIVAGGRRACILHYTRNRARLEAGELLLVDWGATWSFYHSDLTRVVPVGKVTARQRAVYEAVYEVHEALVSFMGPGRTWIEVQREAIRRVGEALVALKVLPAVHKEDVAQIKRYFPHGFGHWIGLDVHDWGFRDEPLMPGVVLTCEPGIYLDEEGIGIRIENEVLITERGAENLSGGVLPYDPEWFVSLGS